MAGGCIISAINTLQGCSNHETRLWEMYAHMFVQFGHSAWCPLHALFVINCYPLDVREVCALTKKGVLWIFTIIFLCSSNA